MNSIYESLFSIDIFVGCCWLSLFFVDVGGCCSWSSLLVLIVGWCQVLASIVVGFCHCWFPSLLFVGVVCWCCLLLLFVATLLSLFYLMTNDHCISHFLKCRSWSVSNESIYVVSASRTQHNMYFEFDFIDWWLVIGKTNIITLLCAVCLVWTKKCCRAAVYS